MDKYNMKILKARIIEKNYKQKEIVLLFGIREETLSRWINGNLGNIRIFLDLCDFLDLDIKDLKIKN